MKKLIPLSGLFFASTLFAADPVAIPSHPTQEIHLSCFRVRGHILMRATLNVDFLLAQEGVGYAKFLARPSHGALHTPEISQAYAPSVAKIEGPDYEALFPTGALAEDYTLQKTLLTSEPGSAGAPAAHYYTNFDFTVDLAHKDGVRTAKLTIHDLFYTAFDDYDQDGKLAAKSGNFKNTKLLPTSVMLQKKDDFFATLLILSPAAHLLVKREKLLCDMEEFRDAYPAQPK